MIEVIVFPDVEGLVITYLKDMIANTHVSTKIPDPRPDRLIKVTRVGGNKARINAESAMVTFQCWEATGPAAADLANLAKAYIHALPGNETHGSKVYKITEVGGPAFNPDPETDKPRYQFTVMIDVKGEAL